MRQRAAMAPLRWLLCVSLLVSLDACARSHAPASSTAADTPPAPAAVPNSAPVSSAAANASNAASGAVQESSSVATTASPGQAALERVAALPAAGEMPQTRWTAGVNYVPVVPAQPTDAPPGKIEVVEAFWFACPHCYALDSYLESWRKGAKPPYVEFVRVAVVWDEMRRATARLFYTLQALGKEEALHAAVFSEIHDKGNPLYVPGDDAGTLRLQTAFAVAHGISAQDYQAAYSSFSVNADMQRSDDFSRRYRIDAVPRIVINGKYITDVGMAGSEANLISVINDLVASEKHH
jgi:protein dithiol oxidoreductase (disulfide-forming)